MVDCNLLEDERGCVIEAGFHAWNGIYHSTLSLRTSELTHLIRFNSNKVVLVG